jgi:hypothetical protein
MDDPWRVLRRGLGERHAAQRHGQT